MGENGKKNTLIKVTIGTLILLVSIFIIILIGDGTHQLKKNDEFTIETNGDKYTYKVLKSKLWKQGEVAFVGYQGSTSNEISIPEKVKYEEQFVPVNFIIREVEFFNVPEEASFVVPKTVNKVITTQYEKTSINYILNDINAVKCKGLKVSKDNPYFDSRDNSNCIIEKNTNKLILASGITATIPSSVTEIGSFAFYAKGITELTVPGNVKKIDTFAFYGFDQDTKLTISEGVEDIDSFAFVAENKNLHLEYLYLPSTLKEIRIDSIRFWYLSKSNYYYNGQNINTIMINTLASSIIFVYSDKSFSTDVWNYWNFMKCLLNDNYNTFLYEYSEVAPTEGKHFWHYVDGKITPWE